MTGASLVAIFFSAAFGAMLLSIVLWEQGVWGWSALRAGLAIAPGPLMVPLVSFGVAGRLIARYGPAPVITLGCLGGLGSRPPRGRALDPGDSLALSGRIRAFFQRQ